MYRGKYFRREIAEVIRDIRRVRELGFHKFLLLDDNIAADRDYLLELSGEIGKLGMQWMSQCTIEIGRDAELLQALAGSGCYLLSFGLESITPASLQALDKSWCHPEDYPELIGHITDAGIDVATEMIVGADADTEESLRRTAEFVRRMPIVAPKFYIMTPLPGTDLFERMKRDDRLATDDLYGITASKAAIRHPNMTGEDLNRIFRELYEQVYTYPAMLKRTVCHRRFWRAPGRYLFFLAINLVYRRQIDRGIAPIIM
jgi:radical SAM superfamily enzyme YgiQ (UPF0313 family)